MRFGRVTTEIQARGVYLDTPGPAKRATVGLALGREMMQAVIGVQCSHAVGVPAVHGVQKHRGIHAAAVGYDEARCPSERVIEGVNRRVDSGLRQRRKTQLP